MIITLKAVLAAMKVLDAVLQLIVIGILMIDENRQSFEKPKIPRVTAWFMLAMILMCVIAYTIVEVMSLPATVQTWILIESIGVSIAIIIALIVMLCVKQ
jgi:hypothetical protein